MKVSYLKRFGNDGTVYRQTITMKVSRAELDYFNYQMKKLKKRLGFGEIFNGHCMIPNNLTPVIFGENYLNLSQFAFFHALLEWENEKRVKSDRNTILKLICDYPK